jgi:hypothetical protein
MTAARFHDLLQLAIRLRDSLEADLACCRDFFPKVETQKLLTNKFEPALRKANAAAITAGLGAVLLPKFETLKTAVNGMFAAFCDAYNDSRPRPTEAVSTFNEVTADLIDILGDLPTVPVAGAGRTPAAPDHGQTGGAVERLQLEAGPELQAGPVNEDIDATAERPTGKKPVARSGRVWLFEQGGCNRAIPDETRGNQGDCLAKRC